MGVGGRGTAGEPYACICFEHKSLFGVLGGTFLLPFFGGGTIPSNSLGSNLEPPKVPQKVPFVQAGFLLQLGWFGHIQVLSRRPKTHDLAARQVMT